MWGPPFAEYAQEAEAEGPGESAYFLAVCLKLMSYVSLANLSKVNRNKKSIGLSFAHPEGVSILHQLAAQCDILVENYLTGALAKYKMDYETISKINPKLVYASVTGYGQTGPYSKKPGYDVMVEA